MNRTQLEHIIRAASAIASTAQACMLRSLVTLLALLTFTGCDAADTQISGGAKRFEDYPSVLDADVDGGHCSVRIVEVIDAQLAEAAEAFLSQSDCLSLLAFMGSPGGDIDAAMRIGRLLRNAHATAIAIESRPCVSACVLAFAGAVSRAASAGSIGVHSVWRSGGDASVDASAVAYENVRLRIVDYLNEMRIPVRLLDLMYSASPSEMRMLSNTDLSDTLLNGDDPVWHESEALAEARALNISVAELYRRRARSEAECNAPPDPWAGGTQEQWVAWMACKHEIEHGAR